MPNEEIESKGVITDDFLWYEIDIMAKAIERQKGQLYQLKSAITARMAEQVKANEILHHENTMLRYQLKEYQTHKE